MIAKLAAPFRFCVHAVRVLATKDSYPSAVQLFWCFLGFKLARIRFKLTRKSIQTPYHIRLAGHIINGPLYEDLWEMFSEVFLSETYWAPLPERPKIIDCGSNVGCATLYFKLLAPSANIICFEPSPVTFSYLKQNVDKNKFAEVNLVQAACGKENGVITFFIDPTHSTGSTAKEIWECEMEKCEVAQVRLSDFIDETIDLLKLDVEGAECDVLEDLERANKLAFVQRMIIEFHHNLKPSQSNMGSFLAILERAGFVYTIDASCSRACRFASGWQSVMLYVWRPSA
jgi:FkbM family methyltransferase